MTAVGELGFALLLWSAILGVAIVFLYELLAVARDAGWVG